MSSPQPARPVRRPLPGAGGVEVARWLRGEPRAVALSGDWAGTGLILSSHPLVHATPDAEPFALLDAPPLHVDVDTVEEPIPAIGGGWLGWFGFGLARRIERLPPPPPHHPAGLAEFDLAFHDHLVRRDPAGRWWFEALWSEAREAVLREREWTWRERLRTPPPPPASFTAGALRPRAPGAAGHAAGVAEVVARIAAGEISQANLCLRLEAECAGDPLDLWVRAVQEADPAYAAYVGGEHALASLSPELFLRRRGRTVQTRPIKGTSPRDSDPAELRESAKDRAENVMIVDLMRNDLGRVCDYGTVEVAELHSVEPAAGVWHLVSAVRGRLRQGVGDEALLRATFPPGSVTGAPKVHALRVIHALEASAREAYCGAIGLVSPLAGLELSVAIRTIEVTGGRLWLGVGGGIVADSDPAAEVAEAIAKAAGVAGAAGLGLRAPSSAAARAPTPSSPAARAPAPIVELPRPEPGAGVFETLRVRAGSPVAASRHLARLRAGCAACGLPEPRDLQRRLNEAAAGIGDGGVRVQVDPGGVHVSTRGLPPRAPTRLLPVVLPGGLGEHKWADRALIDALSAPGMTPLFCDLDGEVLEAGYAAVLILRDGTLVAPPLDGRRLASVSRELTLAAARRHGWRISTEPFTLAHARAAEALVLCSSLRGPHPGLLDGGPGPDGAWSLCAALSD